MRLCQASGMCAEQHIRDISYSSNRSRELESVFTKGVSDVVARLRRAAMQRDGHKYDAGTVSAPPLADVSVCQRRVGPNFHYANTGFIFCG